MKISDETKLMAIIFIAFIGIYVCVCEIGAAKDRQTRDEQTILIATKKLPDFQDLVAYGYSHDLQCSNSESNNGLSNSEIRYCVIYKTKSGILKIVSFDYNHPPRLMSISPIKEGN